jgi:hypothetical protein
MHVRYTFVADACHSPRAAFIRHWDFSDLASFLVSPSFPWAQAVSTANVILLGSVD